MLKRFAALLLSLMLMLGGTVCALDDSESGSGESIPYAPGSISLTASSLTLPENASGSLTAVTGVHYGMPEDSIKWSSSDTSVCTVSAGATSYNRTKHQSTSKAAVKSVKPGKCTVTASFGSVKKSCTVYVLATPKLALGTVSAASVQVKWNQVTHAEGYRVYRRTENGSWGRIANISSGSTLSYTDKTADPLTAYRYTVRALRKDGSEVRLSNYDAAGVSVSNRLPAPKLVSAKDTGSRSVRISWEPSKNAEGYRVYRKTAGAKWARIATLSGQDTAACTDKNAEVGTKYFYTVRAYCSANGKTVLSSYNTKGISAQLVLAQPKLVSAKDTGSRSVRISWEPSKYAEGYRVYRKTEGANWARIATLSGQSTQSCTDTKAVFGTKYIYTVRAYSSETSGTVLSSYNSAGVSCQLLPARPKLVSAKDTGSGSIRISWESSKYAEGYRVYRKTEGGKWAGITTLSGSGVQSYTDTKAAFGTRYIYTVRAYCKAGGKTVLSTYDSAGVSCQLLPAQPKLVSAQDTGSGSIRVSWEASKYAEGYRVYRRIGNAKWARIANLSSHDPESYEDTAVQPGTTYSYTVRALCVVNGTTVLSTYDTAGVSAAAADS